MLSLLAFVVYLLIVLSLIWGRLRFFKVNAGTPRLAALLYDFAVAVQMILTAYFFINVTDVTKPVLGFCLLLYLCSLMLFWWAIFTAKSLDFAFSNHVGSIVTTGPFGLFRHPFYVSYMLAWIGSTVLFNSPFLWLTLVYLIAFYALSARKEEGLILKSTQAEQYQYYQQHVGMFLPRIKKWKQSNSEP
ncbi:MAG: isoprenylcysteine carboxylmethyltransferase family protein [Pseudohongiella sp.]|uniref:isoprenylcysteine carboxylmethyltransferase family protein n=1 Tax=Pseudohongiella sp. TaxID=1979412 RepID=UPI0034A09823